MRHLSAVAFVVLALGSQAVLACGDKFALLGRGARFQQTYDAIHPGRILLVVPPKSVKQAAIRDPQLKKALKKAGHEVDEASPLDLRRALSAVRYDIVLTSRADLAAVSDGFPDGAA